MKQNWFKSLAILYFDMTDDMTDEINNMETGNAFVSSHETRLNQFGKFTSDGSWELFIFPNSNFFISF